MISVISVITSKKGFGISHGNRGTGGLPRPVELAGVLKLLNQHERAPSRVDSEALKRVRAQQDPQRNASQGFCRL